jgi:hypothetical protein
MIIKLIGEKIANEKIKNADVIRLESPGAWMSVCY